MKRTLTLYTLCVFALSGCGGGIASAPGTLTPNAFAQAQRPASTHANSTPSVVIYPAKVRATVSDLVLGANEATWNDITLPAIAPAFKLAGMRATRWPGGSESDEYHWKTNSIGVGACSGGYVYPPSTFDNFVADVVKPANLDLALTVNYGSNPQCTDGASPSEAAGWVAYANNVKHYNVKWWSVGNEEFGASWEIDEHQPPSTRHDPTTYAKLVATQFYPQMKAASKTPINVCVDAEPGWYTGWDPIVLKNAKYDCVELHYYPEAPGQESDSFIIDKGAPQLTSTIDALKQELKTAGHPNASIYVGEIGSVYSTPGKQSMSITQALYTGQAIGEMLNDGVARSTWWFGYGNCSTNGNMSSSLYGWQDFGGYELFEEGPNNYGCSAADAPTNGTLMASGRAFEVASHFVRQGEHVLALQTTGLPNVRAYATTYNGGYAVMLFNVDEYAAVTVPVKIAGKASGAGGSTWTYDKAIYDLSKSHVWQGPSSGKLPAWSGTFDVTLPPWSMVVVQTT
ncbi:MAG: hypothetical protein JO199_07505 [Candidatus Eremiobacteraeota bacterium]|nr:hypothetical protein [Candidatus Eremiobacteraeota bacterium]